MYSESSDKRKAGVSEQCPRWPYFNDKILLKYYKLLFIFENNILSLK
jgi:hypothetical protein